MNKRTKSILSIFAFLIIGFICGSLVHRAMMHRHMEHIKKLRNEEGMIQFMFDRMELDQNTRNEIKPLIESHVKEIIEERKLYRENRKESLDSIKEIMIPLISDDKKEHLNKIIERMKSKGPRHKKK